MSPIWFPQEEYEARFAKLRVLLDEGDIDALMVSHEVNVRYYAGYRQPTPHVSKVRVDTAILPRVGDPVIWVHAIQTVDARLSCWFGDVRPINHLFGPPVEEISAELRARGIRRLAAELGREQRLGMPERDFRAIAGGVPGMEVVDGAEIIWHQRIRKSPAELDCLRAAGLATARGYEHGFPRIEAGMTEREAARILQQAMLEGGAEQIAFCVVAAGMENYKRVGLGTDRRLEKGNMVWIDMGARVNDYCSDFSRGAVIGGVTDEQKRMQELVLGVTNKGVEKTRAGVPVAEVTRACHEELRRLGRQVNFLNGRIGHGVGLNDTEPPHVALYDPTVLEPGMVITIEPGIVEPYGIFDVEDVLIVTEGEPESIAPGSRELWSI